MADYDLDMNTQELVTRVNEFQKVTGLSYGTGAPDFQGAFLQLIRATRYDAYRLHIEDGLIMTTLRDWVQPILEFEYVWFDDEGEHWSDRAEDASWPVEKRRLVSWVDEGGLIQERSLRGFLEDRFVIKASLRFNRSLRELFKEGYPGRHEIVRLFGRSHYARTIPYYWASNGL